MILKDLGLSSQILKLGNSAAYNRSERSVIDVAHAITLLGWENVRSVASALKYVEHFAGQSPGLRELMVTSLLSGFHVREVAFALHYPKPEDAYIAGLFRSLGEVLIAKHYPKEYSEIVLIVQDEKLSWDAACVRVLHFGWDEVAKRVAENWRLPPKVIMCMGGGTLDAHSILDRCLASMTDNGHRLTNSLYRQGAPFHTVQLGPVLNPQGQPTLISVRDLRRVIDSAMSDTQGTLKLLHIPSDTLLLSKQADRARAILEGARTPDPAAVRALDAAMLDAARELARGEFDLSHFVQSLIGQLQWTYFDRVVFGLVNDDRTRIRGRLGSGDSVDEFLDRFEFPFDDSDGTLMALQRKVDMVVDRATDTRYDETSFVKTLGPGVFLLLPIVIDGQTVGCVYADCARSFAGLGGTLGPCGRVRDLITQAIRRKAAASDVGEM